MKHGVEEERESAEEARKQKTGGYGLLDATHKTCLEKKGVIGSAKCDEQTREMKFES